MLKTRFSTIPIGGFYDLPNQTQRKKAKREERIINRKSFFFLFTMPLTLNQVLIV